MVGVGDLGAQSAILAHASAVDERVERIHLDEVGVRAHEPFLGMRLDDLAEDDDVLADLHLVRDPALEVEGAFLDDRGAETADGARVSPASANLSIARPGVVPQ